LDKNNLIDHVNKTVSFFKNLSNRIKSDFDKIQQKEISQKFQKILFSIIFTLTGTISNHWSLLSRLAIFLTNNINEFVGIFSFDTKYELVFLHLQRKRFLLIFI
jgi:hypothetical protein